MFLADLSAALPEGRLIVDPDVVDRYLHDEAEWAPYERPLAVLRPRTAEEVQIAVQLCVRHRTPVVPRGAGTGLSGVACPR
jgi:glycolate oxidase